MGRDPIVLLIVFVAALNLPGSNAHIAKYDEYWKNKAEASKKATSEAYHPDPYNVTNHLNHHVHRALKERMDELEMARSNSTRRGMAEKYKGPCLATNPIDRCWRCTGGGHWEYKRQKITDCVLGFGRGTTGGKGGKYYLVTDPSDNDMMNPKPGTLRHAVIQEEPLWIIFKRGMYIKLNQELILTSNKTIDARGANVHISDGAQITIQFAHNIIIHGLHIHDIVPGSGGDLRDSTSHHGFRTKSDGDGISIFGGSRIWIDHCSLARCKDGLIDAIQGSTAITISNCHMADHNDVFLFGAKNEFSGDKKMQITVAFNNFGKGLTQRMPRARYGFVHVLNNDYTHWQLYAIGGSQNPTIISQGNRFNAPPEVDHRQVTKREAPESEWKSWTWRSENDLFLGGAYFRQSGSPLKNNPFQKDMIPAAPGTMVRDLAKFAGPTKCRPNQEC